MHNLTKTREPSRCQVIRAVRAADCDNVDYWFCSYSGNRIQTRPGHYGYFCPGCNAVAPRIERVRSFRS